MENRPGVRKAVHKPTEVECIGISPYYLESGLIADFVGKGNVVYKFYDDIEDSYLIVIHTKNGYIDCNPFDVIIKNANGDIYVVSSEMFEKLYDIIL